MAPSDAPRQLLQIEEPAEHDPLADRGLAIGLEVTPAGLRIAVSVGGNVELVPGEGGSDVFQPVAGDLAEAVGLAARRLTGLTGRLVTHAVVVMPDGADAAEKLALMQAVEAGGLEVMRLLAQSRATDHAPAPAVLGAALTAEEMFG